MSANVSVDKQQVSEAERFSALEQQVAVMATELERYKRERNEYKKLYELTLLELERTRRHLFGQKAERVDPDQLQMAFGPVAKALEQQDDKEDDETAPDQGSGDKSGKRRRRRTPHGRQKLSEHLAVERIELPPAELDGDDADQYERIGEEVSETLEWRTGSYVRVQVVRPKMVLKGDQEAGVFIAPPVEKPIDKGLAGPGLLSHVLVNKFCDHLPLHRLEKMFEREGIHVSRSTLCDWVMRCHELCHVVVDAMWQDALQNSSYVAVDATGVLVQQKVQCRKGHFWVLISENEHVLFRYTTEHTKKAVEKVLGDYKGYVQADAATVFDFLFNFKGCTEVGCWSHCRRRFFEAIATDQQRSLVAIGYIRKLYKIDREIQQLPAKKQTKERAARAGPVVDAFYEWADSQALEVLPESPIGKAITYARNQRKALLQFLEDGRLRLDNNWSERELRREAIGRRNWTFVGSDNGAVWNTTFVSLIASCQLHGIEPWAYLRDILCLLPSWPKSRALDLSPKRWNETLKQPETQKLLDANPFRKISMGRGS